MGLKEKCGDVVSKDEARKKFKERLKKDSEFRETELRWTKKTVDEYLKDYDERGRVGGPNIHSAGGIQRLPPQRRQWQPTADPGQAIGGVAGVGLDAQPRVCWR